jgi:hypothetical protein
MDAARASTQPGTAGVAARGAPRRGLHNHRRVTSAQDQDGIARLREIKGEEARDERAPEDIRADGQSRPGPEIPAHSRLIAAAAQK